MKDNKTNKIGRTPDISEIEIIEAGKKLIEVNARVSGCALRKAVGRKGDPIRMIRIWDEYQSSIDTMVESSTDLTPEVKKVLADSINSISTAFELLVVDMYKKAKSDAQGHISSAINLAEMRKIKADNEMQDAIVTIDELEQELSVSTEYLDVSESKNEKLEIENTDIVIALKKQKYETKEQNNLLEIASQENEQLVKVAELKEKHIETLAQNITDLKADKAVLQKEVEHLKLELFDKSQEHNLKIENVLNKLENRLDDAA